MAIEILIEMFAVKFTWQLAGHGGAPRHYELHCGVVARSARLGRRLRTAVRVGD